MKRLHATALAAALAVGGPVWGDPPAPARADQFLTLTKDGKPHQYLVVKSYKHPSGGTAYDIKDAATGEVLTVIENATPDQIKATLKPEVVTEVKPEATGKSDPILQPRAYVGDPKIQKKMGADPIPPAPQLPPAVSQYTRPPVPAAKRWFGWMQKDAKPATTPKTQKPPTTTPAPPSNLIQASYRPDPVYRLIGRLRDELMPSMRENAAEELADIGRNRPEVIAALIDTAGHDPAPSVRLCCIRLLDELHVQTPACRAALQTLQYDRHPGVRTEATMVLANWQHR